MSDRAWIQTKWWRVLDADGLLWCESSDEMEVRAEGLAIGQPVMRLYEEEPRREWRVEV